MAARLDTCRDSFEGYGTLTGWFTLRMDNTHTPYKALVLATVRRFANGF